ncbi:MAG: T9SS type A sorting domain-containing protein, partial [Bacteroidota bacterium]
VFMISLPADVLDFEAILEVYDLSGRILMREAISLSGLDSPLPFELNLQAGLYELRLQDTQNDNRRYIRKLLVQ